MNTTILIYIILIATILILIWILMIEIRFKKFFAKTSAHNFEEMVGLMGKKINQLDQKQKEIDQHLILIDDKLSKTIRNVKSIRFNPFDDAGGNQSFAISMINDNGDGIILSSLYARDRMSIFAKPIENYKSEFELTKEEKMVLERSKE